MEFEEVVTAARVQAIAASQERLYVSDGRGTNIFALGSFDQERSAPITAREIVCDRSAKTVVVLEGSRAHIYSDDFRRKLYSFESGSASLIAASGGTALLVSKRRLRWVRRGVGAAWEEESLAIAGITAICIHDRTVYAAVHGQVLSIDLTARLVRQLGPKLPTGWGAPNPLVCYADSLIVVSGTQGWHNGAEFILERAPAEIASLGQFWLAGYKTHLEVWYGSRVVTRLEIGVQHMCNDGFVATSTGLVELKPKITLEFIQRLFEANPEFALSLATGLEGTEMNELRIKQAHNLLADQHWEKGVALLQQANAPPETVVAELSPFLDEIPEPEPTADSPTASSAGSFVSGRSYRLGIPQIDALIPYLTRQRRRLAIKKAAGEIKGDTSAQSRLIDTELFRCYYLNKSSLMGPLVRNKNSCEADYVIPRLERLGRWRDLVGFFKTKQMHTEALKTLADKARPADTVAYLDTLQSWDLVKKFAPAALEKEPELAEVLFSETKHDPHDVYEFLSDIRSEYTLKYLRAQVEAGPDDASIHQDLAIYYLDNKMLTELENFLNTDTAYKPQELLPRIPKKLYHTRIILLSRLGEYEKVINIYITHKEIDEAQKYCAKTYKSDPVLGEKALAYLYNHILKECPDKLITFLNSQGHRLDPKRILSDLSDSKKMSDLSAFFTNQSRELLTRAKVSGATKSLAQAALSDSTYDLTQLRATNVTINSATTCKHCKKRLGLGTVGVWKGLALHYGCIDAFRSIY